MDGYDCGLGAAFQVIGGKWKALLLWEIHYKPIRFGELKRRVPGISEKMLIQQLREMEKDGVISRKAYHEVPPRVEYSITEFGTTLNEALVPLSDWGLKYEDKIAGTTTTSRQHTLHAGVTG
ncbi:MAG TPA: helix-turn-helix domain-containing protein [Verrucomicrobiae bacterium]|nr:helix-turn-helix domain-containing protein [Verrucomicrobiae bacterium]